MGAAQKCSFLSLNYFTESENRPLQKVFAQSESEKQGSKKIQITEEFLVQNYFQNLVNSDP